MTEENNNQQDPADVVPSEAGFSLNWHMLDKSGCDVSVTMRCAFVQSWPAIFSARAAFMEKATAGGWTLLGKPMPAPSTERNHDSGRPAKPAPTGKARQEQGHANSFDAEKLIIESKGGKDYYKVMGGRFKKFGVTIWPEALQEAGIDPEEVDPRRGMDLTGWTAVYVENDEGKPQKVTQLFSGEEKF